MNIKKKLQNPFVLVGQGFLIGAAIFLATHDPATDGGNAGPVAEASFLDRVVARL